jgi:GNAT superfamily N-acetyltransferase
MPSAELEADIATGVAFWGYAADGVLAGVMGIQPVQDVDLIRHAYVRPASQRQGIGGKLLEHLRVLSGRQMLVGAWADAQWAVRFYRQHGFVLVPDERKTALLQTYWTVPKRQIEASVVLANPASPR